MIDDPKTFNHHIDNTTFWDMYPIDLSTVEDVSVQSLPVSVRVTNLLIHNGIKTVADLFRMKVEDFTKLRGAGAKCYEETCKYLATLSSKTVPLDPSIIKARTATKTPAIIVKNIENILKQDFTFCKSIPADSEDIKIIAKYQEAIGILGADFARICYQTPYKVTPLMEALDPLVKSYQEREYRKKQLYECISSIQMTRCNNCAYAYINIFTKEEEKRKILSQIFNLDNVPTARLKDYVFEKVAESVSDFALLLKFLKWCTFDIQDEISELFEKLYGRSKSIQNVLEGRAAGKTLGDVGEKMGITRERVRQIELKAKRIFCHWYSRTYILEKISAEKNGETVLSISDLYESFGDAYGVMLYLLRTVGSSTYYYDPQFDAFIMGDGSLSAIIGHIVEKLPDVFDERKYSETIFSAVEEQNIPQELIEKAILDEFQKDGATYHRIHLSLNKIYTEILEKYYPTGIDIYNEDELQKFRDIAVKEYGCDNLPTKNRSLSARLSDIGILCGRGKYRPKKKSYISKELSDKIYNHIINSSSVIFMTNTLFSIFEDELLTFGIDNKYYLQGILHELFDSEFVFRRDYISKDESVTSFYVEIIKYIKRFSHPITKEDIQKAFPGVTEIVISFATSDPNIINLYGKYIHVSKLNITDSDKKYFEKILAKFVNNGKVRHYKDLYDYIDHDDSDLLRKLFVNFPTSLFSVLEYLFSDRYQFKRPFIAQMGIEIDAPDEQLKDLILNNEKIAISDITAFAKENRYIIYSILEYLNSYNTSHLLMDMNTLATIDHIGITDTIAKNVIAILQDEVIDTCLITSLECIYRLPKINVPWTEWLIYSIVNKWGETLEVSTTSNQFKLSVPLIAPYGKMNTQKFAGIAVDATPSIPQIDDLDNIDDLIADYIEFDLDEDLI